MPWSKLVGGSRPQSWMRFCSTTVRTARPQSSWPRIKQMPVFSLVTSLSRRMVSSALTWTPGSCWALRPFRSSSSTVTYGAVRAT